MNRQELRRRIFATSALLNASMLLAAGGGGSASDTQGPLDYGPYPQFLPPQPSPSTTPGTVPRAETDIDDDDSLLDLSEIPVLIQAIVEPVSKTDEGSIVQTIGPAWRAILALLSKDPDAIRQLSPRQLEELIAASYEEEGFDEVTLTPRSGDRGRDVIAVKYGFCTVRIIDQVKHFAPNHKVTANDVRALVGVLLSDERATKGFVTTTSSFAPGIETDPFIAKHVPFRLELVDGKGLHGRWRKYHGRK